MGLLWALVVGLIVGALAKLVMPGRDPGGIIVTMLLGVAGSFLALLIGRALGMYDMRDDGPGIIASVLGSVLLLAGYRALAGRRRRLL
ncbi:MAG: transglycosylase [Myxococcaceae bacterium]|nr:transglycosylase [Myxococcaceae bacterium]